MLVLALLFPVLLQASGQTTIKPEIVDITTGTAVTGASFTVKVSATSALGVSYVRLYLWFRIPPPLNVTQIQYIIMEHSGGPDYESTFEVPGNAITLSYYITAYDTQNTVNSTDAISRQVRDNVPPVAFCNPYIDIEMGQTANFNGAGSTDNVAVSNYTWSFSYDGNNVKVYGKAPGYIFKIPGQYPGTLFVKDAWGNSDSSPFQVNVTDTESPVADAGIDIFIAEGDAAYIDGFSSTDNLGIVNYTWTYIQNGTLWTLYGETVSIRFWRSGQYNVTLTVSDAAGNTDSAVVPVHVLKSPSDGSMSFWIYVLIVIIMMIIIATIIIIRI
jgi:hypothetical protein